MKAWGTTTAGFPDGFLAAESRGRALMLACESMRDAGFVRSIRDAMKAIRVYRAPDLDEKAEAAPRDGYWVW